MLTKLRESGKKLFIATNSHTEYSNLIMSTTIGEDWLKFFDLACCYCRKPVFFTGNEAPFYAFDPSKKNLKGKMIYDSKYI